jgi:tetratricopeptide (TPR) repeat protein
VDLRLVLMTMLALPGAVELSPTRFAAVAVVERIALPVAVPQLLVEPLDATIELRTNLKDVKALYARITALVGQICPEVSTRDASVFLRCRTRRIDAQLVPSATGPALEVRELRGLPYRGSANYLRVFYDLGPEEACPGTMSVARAECELQAGHRAKAVALFREALNGPEVSMASLRLGDIALETGDPETATAWYRRTAPRDKWGKLAKARLCEMQAECLDGKKLAQAFETHVPDPAVIAELDLRYARVLAFQGKASESARLIAGVLAKPELGACDTMGQVYCRRLVLFALEQAEESAGAETLETYLALPDRGDGELRLELVRAAAELSARLGAPEFGGNMLAASASWVDNDTNLLRDHLLRAAEMFLMAGDRPRARIIYDYAESRFPRKHLGDGRWLAVGRDARAISDQTQPVLSDYETLAAEGARDVAAAFGVLARLRAARQAKGGK